MEMRLKSVSSEKLGLAFCLVAMLGLNAWGAIDPLVLPLVLPLALRYPTDPDSASDFELEQVLGHDFSDCDTCPSEEYLVNEYGEEAATLNGWVEDWLEEDPAAVVDTDLDEETGALTITVAGPVLGVKRATALIKTERYGTGDEASVKVTLSKPRSETLTPPAAAAAAERAGRMELTAAEGWAAKANSYAAAAGKSSQATLPQPIAAILKAINEVYRSAKLGEPGALAAAQAEAARAYAAFKDYLGREAAAGRNPLAKVPPPAQRLLAAVDSVFKATRKVEKAAREAAASRDKAPPASAAVPGALEATAPAESGGLESRLAALVKTGLDDLSVYTPNPNLGATTLSDLRATYNALRSSNIKREYTLVNTRWRGHDTSKDQDPGQYAVEIEVATKMQFPGGPLVEAISDLDVTVEQDPCPPYALKISRLPQPPVLYKNDNTFEVSSRRGACRRDGILQSGTSLLLTRQGQLVALLPAIQAVIFNCCTLAGVVRATLQIGNTSATAFNGSVTFNISGTDGLGAYNRAATVAGLAIPGFSLSALINLLFPPAAVPPASIDNGNCTSAEASSCQLNPGGPLPGLCGLLCL